ncbi:MAG: hypothetical protein ACYDD6_02415 [Acidimicrobiales bacterium]
MPCTYTLLTTEGIPGLGVGGSSPGQWYIVSCPVGNPGFEGSGLIWVPDTTGYSAPGTTIDPMAMAEQAASSIALPVPTIELNPASFSIVNLATWLAIDPSIWHSYSATASAGALSATAVVAPESVTWTMGDGTSLICDGPGIAYRTDLPASAQQTYCSYTYRRSSIGQPSADGNPNDGAFPVMATVTWAVSWSATGVSGGGSLPPLQTSSTTRVRVEQVQSVDTVR